MRSRYIEVLLIFFLVGICIPTTCTIACPSMSYQFDKSTIIKKKISNAQNCMSKGEFQKAIGILNSVLRLSPQNSIVTGLLKDCQDGINKKKEVEANDYRQACIISTRTAFYNFLTNYPNSEKRDDIKRRILDLDLWTKARSDNTVESYQNYLKRSSTLSFKEEAYQAIKTVEEAEEWFRVKTSSSLSEIKDFLSRYPKSSHEKDAKGKLYMLQGEEYYQSGSKSLAYSYFESAMKFLNLYGNYALHYEELKKEKEYNDVLATYDINKVTLFMRSLSVNDPFYNGVSNKLALLKADDLGLMSTEEDFAVVRSYCKDEATLNKVESYIESAKRIKKEYEKEQRKYRRQLVRDAHKRWWKANFSVGIEGDVESNLGYLSSDGDPGRVSNLFASGGLMIRFGKTEHVFNLISGVKYRWINIENNESSSDDSDISFSNFAGYIAVPLYLRLNFASAFDNAKFFISAGGEYGISNVLKKDLYSSVMKPNYLAFVPQLGIGGNHFELSFYWKTYVDGPFVKGTNSYGKAFDCKNIYGMQMAIYF